jgi:hypothetical protein
MTIRGPRARRCSCFAELTTPRVRKDRLRTSDSPKHFRGTSKGDARTESPRDFYDGVERRGGAFREMAFEFDKLAVAYSQKGFETLTYLYGGALVALPAALAAFFKADIPRASIILTGSEGDHRPRS